MIVNLFLSSHVWTAPLNAFGVRQHVAALYEEVFRGSEVRVYPRNREGGLLVNGLRHLPALLSGGINVLTQGYPIVTGALATWITRNPRLIVHTWKVPGFSDERMSAKVNDLLLRRVINRARAVVVVSKLQRRQLEALGVSCPVVFAPVSVDSAFWRADPEDLDAVLMHFGLAKHGYILTAGGPDRDEVYAARVARILEVPYVRASWDIHTAERSRLQLAREGLENYSRILNNPSDVELRALYAGAHVVCLPTLTRTNPAGLTSLVTAMACGAAVAIPETIAEGYIEDGTNGLVFRGSPDEFAARTLSLHDKLPLIRQKARQFAENELNTITVAKHLKTKLQTQRVLD
ncbi:MAG: glycosyltransferase [Nitrospirae bacterium]|nr:glycosyltransferase [Nitrospirota bacterium]